MNKLSAHNSLSNPLNQAVSHCLGACVIVVTFMRVWLSSSRWLCRLNITFRFLLSWCNVYLYLSDSDEQIIYDNIYKRSNQWSSICCRTEVICIIVIIVISNIYSQLSNILITWMLFHPYWVLMI